jgi:hypothetical protein
MSNCSLETKCDKKERGLSLILLFWKKIISLGEEKVKWAILRRMYFCVGSDGLED